MYLDSIVRVYHGRAMKKAISISVAESQIMQALWRKSPLTPEEIIAAAGPPNGWAAGTVRTLITRLLRKKALLGARKDGVYLYRPLIARADYVQAESQSLLDRLFQGQVAPLVAHFAEARALTAKDIQKLKKLIAELEKDHD
jgi:BlaI family penicillinase repressor